VLGAFGRLPVESQANAGLHPFEVCAASFGGGTL
jgi:hypothetical protein